MHIILTGATGIVGGASLHAMLRNESITKISILSRRPVPYLSALPGASKKCTVILHSDFSNPPTTDVLAQLKGAKGCVWALGVSVNDVDKDVYRKITIDFPLTFAKTFSANTKENFNFVYVSGEGATTEPSMLTQRFGVVKGQAESALLDLSKQQDHSQLKVYSARPGGVDDGFDPELQKNLKDRKLPTWQRYLGKPLLAVMRPLYPSMISPTRDLGDALVKLAAGDGDPLPDGPGISGEGRTLANVALRRLVGI